MVRDEALRLPVWLRYYRPVGDVVVLDDGSTDGGTDGIDVPVVAVGGRYAFDHQRLTTLVMAAQRELLARYRVVVFAEVDEFLVWRHGPLAEFLATVTGPVRATGWQVVQRPDEPPLDWTRPLLAQRGWMGRDPDYDKTLISTTPVSYIVSGFHHCAGEGPPDPALWLLHTKWIDLEAMAQRAQHCMTLPWAPQALARGEAEQSRATRGALAAVLAAPPWPLEPVPDWARVV